MWIECNYKTLRSIKYTENKIFILSNRGKSVKLYLHIFTACIKHFETRTLFIKFKFDVHVYIAREK